jgi:hypothetical protein
MSEPKKWSLGPKLLTASAAVFIVSIGLCSTHNGKLGGWGVILFFVSPLVFLVGLIALLVEFISDKSR